jgi:hypothetical protein
MSSCDFFPSQFLMANPSPHTVSNFSREKKHGFHLVGGFNHLQKY